MNLSFPTTTPDMQTARRGGLSYLLLFLPYIVASYFTDAPSISFLVAWVGSLFIFWVSLSGFVKPLPQGRSAFDQVMRPIVLTQIIYASYNGLSSIFYFIDLKGMQALSATPGPYLNHELLDLVAQAQRYYVLAHAALVMGMLLAMGYGRSGKWRLRPDVDVPQFLLTSAALLGGMVWAFRFLPGAEQLVAKFNELGLLTSVLSLVAALHYRRGGLLLINLAIYVFNMVGAFLSGWKEEVLVCVLLLGLFVYPFYRRTVLLLTPLVLGIWIVVMPAYAGVFRDLNWYGNLTATDAARIAISRIRDGQIDLSKTTWQFLTGRSSEINMFTKYIARVPQAHDYYGAQLAENAVQGLVPRVLWNNKPNLERIAMERAYELGVVPRVARGAHYTSAKPQFIVDAYLSAGAVGVFLACLLFGVMASWASTRAEEWFGGYTLGSGLVYNALFMTFWRGNSFEFVLNSVFWSVAVMAALSFLGRQSGWLVPAVRAVPQPAPAPRLTGTSRLVEVA